MSRPGQPKPTPAELEQLLVDFKNAADAKKVDVFIRKVSGASFTTIS
jgi:hypothetical protein